MRLPRIRHVEGDPSIHHCTSHLVDPLPFLTDLEKTFFLHRMWKLARFCHMRVLDYSIMSNHFHIATRPPDKLRLSDQALLDTLRDYYGSGSQEVLIFSSLLNSHSRLRRQLRQRYLRRMGDVSVFMKELKEGFTRWYNHQHDRRGTLWEGRFRSTLVQDLPWVLRTLLAYIDLNAVRAGLVEDPLDYPFCGYAAALAGVKEARAGLRSALGPGSWKKQMQDYRMTLFGQAGRSGHSAKRALPPAQIEKVWRQGGALEIWQILRLRIRHFSCGAILGSPEYVERIWKKYGQPHTRGRQTGARRMRGSVWGGLCTLRDLRKQAVGVSKASPRSSAG